MANPPEQSEAADSAPVDETVESDLECAGCRYNLRTLAWNARCPECGLDVWRSRLPAGLRFRAWSAIRRVRWGLRLLVVSVLIASLAHVVRWFGVWWSFEPARPWLSVSAKACYVGEGAAIVCSVWGVLFITLPLGGQAKDRWPRLGIAISSLALIYQVAHIVPLPIVWFSARYTAIEILEALTLLGVWIFLGMHVPRKPNRRLRMACLAAVVACCSFCLYAIVSRALIHGMRLGWVSDSTAARSIAATSLGDFGHKVKWALSLVLLLATWIYPRKLRAVSQELETQPTMRQREG